MRSGLLRRVNINLFLSLPSLAIHYIIATTSLLVPVLPHKHVQLLYFLADFSLPNFLSLSCPYPHSFLFYNLFTLILYVSSYGNHVAIVFEI